MSDKPQLTDAEKMKFLAAVAGGALQTSLGTMAVLAERGQLSPDEAEALLSPLLDQLENVPEQTKQGGFLRFIDAAAEIKRAARAKWKAA